MAHHPNIYVCATCHLSIVLRELGLFKVCDVWRVWRVWRVWASGWTPGRAWTPCAHGTGTLDVWLRLADVWQTSGRVWPTSGRVWPTSGRRLADVWITSGQGSTNDRLNVARGFGCSDTTPESASRFGRSCSATFRGQTLIGQLGG